MDYLLKLEDLRTAGAGLAGQSLSFILLTSLRHVNQLSPEIKWRRVQNDVAGAIPGTVHFLN
jgi:hypothetical protein